jgi:hypothetical protein
MQLAIYPDITDSLWRIVVLVSMLFVVELWDHNDLDPISSLVQ